MIEIKKLNKAFGEKVILKDISVEIREGELFSVIGPSGMGKSTFIKCLIRLLNPESGQIIVDGQDIGSTKNEFTLAKVRRSFGYLFQEGALFDSLTVMENVAFGLKYLTDIPKSDYPRIVKEKLALVGLKDVEQLKPSELSVGMKKRVSLARSVAAEPKYMLYDEPTTGLDPVTTGMVKDLILDMREKLKITSIVVTHDLNLALEISSRVAMLNDGEFVEVSEPSKFRQSENKRVKEFMEISHLSRTANGKKDCE
ncbi:MAG: ABC transporter ATP-binding protein [Elusimicrobia bacterium RIFCSPLOWO2_02_FULL_61_11]|nr:MAG: ABC transporter ATP-binding protein [Elusimicrobia bacterium RIFCSPLOWO2_02_FULL_61_11]